MELEVFLQVAMDVAMQAGNIIRTSFYAVKQVEHKGQVDLVTETDKACEQLIFEHIRKAFPEHKLIGEETTALTGPCELTDAPTWIIDPLDGTTNFVHSFPFVCVSIALAIGKVPVVGVVYNPIMNEMFTAVRGGGAFLNGKAIATSSQKSMGVALLASGVGTKRDKPTVDAITNRINCFLYKVRSIRMVGSCALNLCGVACGRVDIFFDVGFGGPWDVAAGVIIAQEAGGEVFLPSGGNFDFGSRSIAASNGYLKDELVEAFKQTQLLS